MATRQEIAELYVATFNRAADADGLAYWDGTGPVTTGLTVIEDIAAAMLESSEAAALYEGLELKAKIVEMYSNLFNRTVEESDAGVTYWAGQVNAGNITEGELIIALINGALGADKITMDNKTTVGIAFADAGLNSVGQAISVMQDVTSDSSTVTDALQVINEVIGNGNTYSLSVETDTITGTAGNDTFEAYLGQNAGSMSNTISSADKLVGGAGDDSLYAQLVPEYFGTTGDNQIDIQVRTTGIENVEFEARDAGGSSAVSATDTLPTNSVITVDAKDMTGVNKIGSSYSDGDLVIENLTTLTDAGVARNTGDMTITMDHTDSFNSDEDASDLTVYFDEDYLLAGQAGEGGFYYDILNQESYDANAAAPVEDFPLDAIKFSMDYDVSDATNSPVVFKIDVDMTGIINHTQLASYLNAQLGAGNVTATVDGVAVDASSYDLADLLFEVVGTFDDGDGRFSIDRIQLSDNDTTDRDIVAGAIVLSEESGAGNLYWDQGTLDDVITNDPVSINVELTKVGRDGEGGNLIIGAKDQNSQSDDEEDQVDGITEMNILVKGTDAQPSYLGFVTSTDQALTTVNISSDEGSTASLTIADAFNGNTANTTNATNVETVNANEFDGTNLVIGTGTAALNIDTFVATSATNVTLVESINGAEKGDFSVTTGSGADNITINLDGDAVDSLNTGLTVTTSSGIDSVTINGLDTDDVSDNTTLDLLNLNINTGADADKIDLNTEYIFQVNAGAGSDFVEVDALSLPNTLDNNNNVVAVNDGTHGVWTIGDGTGTDATDSDWDARVLYEAELTVDFAGFEETVMIQTDSSGNFIATQETINNAVIAAITNNSELSRLLTVSVGTGSTNNQQLTITSTIEGLNDLTISVFQPTVVASTTPAAGEVSVSTGHLSALEAGLVATGVIDSKFIDTTNGTGGNSGTSGVEDVEDAFVLAGQGNLNETGAAVVADFVLDSADITDGTNDASSSNAIIDMSTGSNDLVALDSADASSDTVVFSAAWGKVSIVNFFTDQSNDDGNAANGTATEHTGDTIGNHIIDFTAWLDDMDTTSGSSLSATRTNTTDVVSNANAIDLSDNEVTIINNFAQNGTETWAAMSASDVQIALTGAAAADDYGLTGDATAISGAATTVLAANNLLGTSIDSILMVENDLNDGEYKVFNVETTNVDVVDEAFNVTYLGVIDFGETIDANAVFA